MAKRNQGVSVKVSSSFFNNIFEPNRKKLEKSFGVKMSQTRFTEYIVRSKAKLVFPKNMNTFAPKKNKRGGLDFSFC